MNAFKFGALVAEKTAQQPNLLASRSPTSSALPTLSRPKPVSTPASYKGGKPTTLLSSPGNYAAQMWKNMPTGTQMLSNMSNNSQRAASGVLSTAAGGIGAAATGALAGATNAWNAATPKSMNTSQGWSQGVNNVASTAAKFTGAGAKDLAGSLGADTNYTTQHAWDQMEKGFNDPTVDSTSQAIARGAGWAGHGVWGAAQTVANPGKILANLPRAGINPLTWARQGSRILPGATGGVQTAATAARAAPQFANAGRALNLVNDWGTDTLQTADVVNQGGRLLYNNIASRFQPQPPENTYASVQQ